MVAVEDARTAARRIVEQVLAEHEARAVTTRDVRLLAGGAGSSPPTTSTPGAVADDAEAPDTPALRTARRIVEEVLAAQARDSSPPPTASQRGDTRRDDVQTAAAVGSPELVEVTTEQVGDAADPVSLPEVVLDLTDQHPLATARRIVEEVLAAERVREQEMLDRQAGEGPLEVGPAPEDEPAAGADAASEVLAERLFAPTEPLTAVDHVATVPMPVPAQDTATEPMPVPDPTPQPVPDPTPQPVPDPVPEPIPDPGPFPTPDPLPDPDPFPPDPSPGPYPPDPEPQPLSGEPTAYAAGGPASGPRTPTPPSAERREAEETARRIVQEVVAAHERAAAEREDAARAEHARLVEEAVLQEETRVAQDALAAERVRTEQLAEAELARAQEQRLAAEQVEAGPFLHELPHPESPRPLLEGPPPIPDAARRVVPSEDVPSYVTTDAGADDPSRMLPLSGEVTPPRTGRWLLTTIIGAVALALLFPLAVHALRSLITLG